MMNSAPKTIPKALPGGDGYMFHARIFPGTVAPKGMGSPYDGVRAVPYVSQWMKQGPYVEASKDPMAIRTTGLGAYGM
jgi:hypothetical protein